MPLTLNILEALAPVLTLVIAGYLFRRKGFLDEAFWQGAESLSYYVLFPALILYRLINADLSSFAITPLIIVISAFFGLLTLCAWLANKYYLRLAHASWTSVLQGSIRYNTFIALALSDKLFGESLFAVSALVVGLFISIVNIITIIAFSVERKPSPLTILFTLIKNPLIIASILGLAVNLIQLDIPDFASDTLSVFGRAALPLAILAVGAGLKLKSLKRFSASLIVPSIIKLLVSPLIMSALCLIFINDNQIVKLLIVFACVPTASAAYILARKLGGDAPLMASLITFQTLLSVFTLILTLYIIL